MVPGDRRVENGHNDYPDVSAIARGQDERRAWRTGGLPAR